MNALWHELVQAAILGTERRPADLPPTPGPVGDLVAALGTEDAEARLLSAAAVASLCARAATTGLPAVALPPTCPAEPRPAAPPAALGLLSRLLALRPALVPEFCVVCDQAGRRLPDALLPALLAHAQREQAARRAIDPVLGLRGRWLAAQNPDWAFAASPLTDDEPRESESVWQTGTREQRLRFLAGLRERDPAAARRLVASGWEQEETATRAEIVKAFATGLDSDDEPFLEDRLDDRRKEVRTAAQALLVRLPDSRLAKRMLERAMACCTFATKKAGLLARFMGGGGETTLEVDLPAACDKAMERDGIAAKVPSGLAVGERNWWFRQILAMVSPSAFVAATGLTAETVETAVAASDFAKEFGEAWHEAARRCADADWAWRLHRRAPERYQDLLPVLRAEQREKIVLENVAGTSPRHLADVAHQLLSFPDGIPPAIARAGAALFRRAVSLNPTHTSPWLVPWEQLAMRFPAELATEALAGWPTEGSGWEQWRNHAGKFLEILELRIEIRRAFAE